MKKIIIYFLTLSLSLSLCACGEIGGSKKPIESEIQEPVSIVESEIEQKEENTEDNEKENTKYPNPHNKKQIKIAAPEVTMLGNIKDYTLLTSEHITEFICDSKGMYDTIDADVVFFNTSEDKYSKQVDKSRIVYNTKIGSTTLNNKFVRYQSTSNSATAKNYAQKFYDSFMKATVEDKTKNSYAYSIASFPTLMDTNSYGVILQYDSLDTNDNHKPYAAIKLYRVTPIGESFYELTTITYESTPKYTQEELETGKEAFLEAAGYYGFPTEGYIFNNDTPIVEIPNEDINNENTNSEIIE